MDVTDIIKFFSEKQSDKRIIYLKSFIELSFVVWYSVLTYLWIFKGYELIEPTSFKDLHTFFLSGRLFVCLPIFIFWFLVVRYGLTILLRGIHYSMVELVKYMRKFVLWLCKKFKRKEFDKFDVIDFLKTTSEKGKFPRFVSEIFRYIHSHYPQDDLINTLYHNILLIVQFCVLFIYWISERLNLPEWLNPVLFGVIIFFSVNLFSFYVMVRFVRKYGYWTFETLDKWRKLPQDNTRKESSYDPDKPIKRSADNRLPKRDDFSKILKNSIEKYTDKEPLVIGIDGKWGDGKTSFINMTLEDIVNGTDLNRHVMFFNPWNFTNSSELTLHFLTDLKRQLRKVLGHQYSGELESKFLLYINYISNGKFETPQETSAEENDTESLKGEIYKILERIDFKLITVVDDLDRLSKKETQQVFQFVKLVGDFPNLIYIIPFDKQNVTTECEIDEDYLKKIIQVEIKLPPILHNEITEILSGELNTLLTSLKFTEFDREKMKSHLNSSLGFYVKNIRDVNRILNTLRFYLTYSPVRELNINDFVYLTIIQIFDVRLYTYIGSNKKMFSSMIHSEMQGIKKIMEEKIEELKTNTKMFKIPSGEFQNLLSGLFPKVQKYGFNHSDPERQRKDHRIGSTEYFDKYFLFPLDEDRLSKKEIENILSNVSNVDKFKKDLKTLLENNTFDFFIQRLFDYRYGPIKINVNNLFRGFLSVGELIPDTTNVKHFGVQTLKTFTVSLMSGYLSDNPQTITEDFIKEIYGNKENDIDLLSELYFKIFKIYDVRKERSFKKEDFLDNDSSKILTILHESYIKRLKTSINELMVSERLVTRLLDWKKFDPSLNLKEVVKIHLEESDDRVIDFIDKMRHDQWIRNGESLTDHERQVYDIKTIKSIVDLEYLEKRMKTIESSLSSFDPTVARNKQFLNNKSIFDKSVSGEINFDDKEWFFQKDDKQ